MKLNIRKGELIMITKEEQRVYDVLDKLNIDYKIVQHKAVYTAEEANEVDYGIEGQHCKNLFLRNRKGNQHYLVILDDSKQADLRNITDQIGSTPLSFASEKRLNKYLGLIPGAVSPFGLINDEEKEVEVLIDKDLAKSDTISFHPNVNTATIFLSYKDFERFLKWCENPFSDITI